MSSVWVDNKIYKKSGLYYNSLSNKMVRVIIIYVLSVANNIRPVNLTNKCQQFKSNG